MTTLNAFVPKLGEELLRRPFEVVDLTRTIFEGMPQWYGHQKTFIMTNQTHEQFQRIWHSSCGFEAHNLLISEHCGTHTDAVFEYDPEGPHLDESPLSLYYGPAVCFDVSAGIGSTDQLSRAALQAAVTASGQTIRSGDTVLLHFGYGDSEVTPAGRTPPDLAVAKEGGRDAGAEQVSGGVQAAGCVACR